MTDSVTLASIATSLRAATDIAKLLKDTGTALEKAELKNRLADLLNALADAKLELSDLRDDLLAKDARIEELQAAFQTRETIVRWGDAYYRMDAERKPQGDPLCLKC